MRYTVSYVVDLRWQLKGKTNYKWSVCKRLYNTRTGREIKKTMKGRSVGYWIGKKFYSLTYLRTQLELIPKKEILPF